MKYTYRIQIDERESGKWYTAQVLLWPSWLKCWADIRSDGYRSFNNDLSYADKSVALKAISNYKKNINPHTVTYEYID